MRTSSISFPVASLLLASAATAQYYEARNAGMGGVGTASSNYLAAGWANPALLTRSRESDDFGLILPALGVTAYDKDGLIDDINSFVDEYDRLTANGATPTTADLEGLANQLRDLKNRQVTGTAGLGVMLAIPSRTFGFALHAKTFADLQAFADVSDNDITAISTGTIPAAATIESKAYVVGVAVTEVGVSMATSFGDEGSRLSVGVTPKLQQIDTYNYGVNATNFEAKDYNGDQYRDDDSAFNVDVGAAWEIEGGLSFGATGRNLIGQTYTTVTTLNKSFTYDVNPTAAAGAAWHYGMLTLAADVDVIVANRFATANGLGDDDVRLARAGAELDLWRWLQLRVGYQTDLEDTLDDAITAGIGLSPFDVLHLDIAGTYIDQNSFGGVAQLGLTF